METGFSGTKPESKMETGVSGMYSNWNYVNIVPDLNCLINDTYSRWNKISNFSHFLVF